MGQTIAFWILAVIIIGSAVGVIAQKNVFRSALFLIVCLVGVAGIFVLLSADFLAVAQILVYVGAISVVIILAIMLTREFATGSPSNRLRIPALFVSLVFLCIIVYAVVNTNWQISSMDPRTPTAAGLGLQIFGQGGFILPLEIVGVVILAVIIGAVVIARDK
jgi:NADH-quinone oxidoreductase subunit J